MKDYNVFTYGPVDQSHWSEDLKMVIRKDGVTLRLTGEEIKQLINSLPRTFGGRLT